jgi:hypothetical protein
MAIKKIRSSFIDTGSTSTQVAVGDHIHSGYALTSHTHSNYAASTHTHSGLGTGSVKAVIAINLSNGFDGYGYTTSIISGINHIILASTISNVIGILYYGSEGKSHCHYFTSLSSFPVNVGWLGKTLEPGDILVIIGQ